jgi:hypothetical protein
MTLFLSSLTISLVPLQRPALVFKFLRSIITHPFFNVNLCGGNPDIVSELNTSTGYANHSLSFSDSTVSILR